MKFDLFGLMQKRDESWSARDVFEDLDEQVRVAEQMGMETAWFAEHHFNNYSLCPSPLMAVAYFAGRTTRIRLGTAVVVAPLYEPMRLLQEIGMADVLSSGRLVLGIGNGYQDYEFERFGVKLEEAVDRTLEILDLIELGLTQESFSYDGTYYQYPSTQIGIRALQRPLPEIWVAGTHPRVQKRVAENGYVPMFTPSWNPIESLAHARDSYRDLYRSLGRDPAELPMGLMRFVHVTNDKAGAREATERARYSSRVSRSLRHGYARFNGVHAEDIESGDEPPLHEMTGNYIIGDAQHCVEKILADYEVMGHSHVQLNVQLGGVPHDRVMRTLDALGSEIVPAVHKELSRHGVSDPEIVQRPTVSRQCAT